MTTYLIYDVEELFTPAKKEFKSTYCDFWNVGYKAKEVRKPKVRKPRFELESIDLNYKLVW